MEIAKVPVKLRTELERLFELSYFLVVEEPGIGTP